MSELNYGVTIMNIETSNNIMLDLSLIIPQKKSIDVFEKVKFLKENNDKLRFFLPSTFRNIISRTNIDISRLEDYYSIYRFPDKMEIIREFLYEFQSYFEWFEVPNHLAEMHSKMREAFKNKGDLLANILFEEWIFLSEHSWVVSRIKKVFKDFLNAGAVYLEFGKVATYGIAKHTLKSTDKEFISNIDYLRALGKWIAVGGPPVISLFKSVPLTFLSTACAGYFLLFDPD